jgi:hypothetical protein
MAERLPAFTQHAKDRMEDHGITIAEVYEALADARKRTSGQAGCELVWGIASTGRRIRVALSPDRTVVVTVSHAGWRSR